MARRQSAELPLHSGSAPRWLFDRMVELGGAIAEVIIAEFGTDELIARLADPYWFQALGCVLGFDWHSSGVTTTTMGALKSALDPDRDGIAVVGGKGVTARETPTEIAETPLSLPPGARSTLQRTSRLSAAVDNGCLQDSYRLYHHTMVVAETGNWCVVQQGMNDGTARRYHWLDESVEEFVKEPHAAICAQQAEQRPLDLTASESANTRTISVDLVQDDPAQLLRELRGQRSLADFGGESVETGTTAATDRRTLSSAPELQLPRHHELRDSDLTERSLEQLRRAYEYQPDDYTELVGIDGIGQGSLRALALIAELVYDAGSSREDPAKYAFAHGGKGGTPHPVKRERYDRSVEHLRRVLQNVEVDRETRQSSLERLAALE